MHVLILDDYLHSYFSGKITSKPDAQASEDMNSFVLVFKGTSDTKYALYADYGEDRVLAKVIVIDIDININSKPVPL